MRLTIAYSKVKKRNLVLINNDTYQRETVSERPIRQPLRLLSTEFHTSMTSSEQKATRFKRTSQTIVLPDFKLTEKLQQLVLRVHVCMLYMEL